MLYVMGALRTVMEWATVPVLAVAMCLPHGALVYWLSSSSVSLLQVLCLARSLDALVQESVRHLACLGSKKIWDLGKAAGPKHDGSGGEAMA